MHNELWRGVNVRNARGNNAREKRGKPNAGQCQNCKFIPQLHDEVNFGFILVHFIQFNDVWMVELDVHENVCQKKKGRLFVWPINNHLRTEINTRISFLRSSSRVCMNSHTNYSTACGKQARGILTSFCCSEALETDLPAYLA